MYAADDAEYIGHSRTSHFSDAGCQANAYLDGYMGGNQAAAALAPAAFHFAEQIRVANAAGNASCMNADDVDGHTYTHQHTHTHTRNELRPYW